MVHLILSYASNVWSILDGLSNTSEFMCAIQDQVIKTKTIENV